MIKEELDPGKVLLIHDFLSGEECAALIRRSECLSYGPGTVADVVIEQVRNNERVLVDDVTLASDLFCRANDSYRLTLKVINLSGSMNGGAFTVMVQGRPSSLIAMGRIYG